MGRKLIIIFSQKKKENAENNDINADLFSEVEKEIKNREISKRQSEKKDVSKDWGQITIKKQIFIHIIINQIIL